jgi:PAS domain S-box-containing protein/putative nucleotidyltransferase with HDIG domain
MNMDARKGNAQAMRILVIASDDLDVPALLADLEFLGYPVAGVARDLTSTLAAFTGEHPDLALVSLDMGTNQNGIEIATRIHQEMNLPVVFLIHGATLDGLEYSRQAEPFGYIFAPFPRAQIFATLETARQRAEIEERMKQQERKYRSIVEHSPVGIFQTGIDGHYLSVNQSLAASLGFASPEEFLADIQDIKSQLYVHPEKREGFIQKAMDAEGFVEVENELRRRDGGQKISLVQYHVIRDNEGKPLYLEGFSQDITARKEADQALQSLNQKLLEEIQQREHTEQVLRESEERYLNFFKNFEGIAFRLRVVGELGNEQPQPVFYHGAVEKITGYTEEELLRGNPRWEQLIHPDDLLMYHNSISPTNENIQIPIDREYRILRCDGQMRWVHEVLQLLAGSDGQVIFIQGAIYDVTLRKQREFEIRAVAAVSSRLSMATSRSEIPPLLLQQVNQLLQARGAALMLYDAETNKAVCELGTGVWEKYTGLRLPEGDITYRVLSERRFYLNNDALNIVQIAGLSSDKNLRGIACIPLVAQQQMIGVLWVAKNNPITGEELRAFAAIGDMAASTLQQATLYDKLQQAYDSTLEGWALALELRDHETQGHSIRVAEATLHLARVLGVNEDELVEIRRGALLHDIGKIAVPDHILLKPGPLDERELEIMRMHPVYAYEMLSPIKFLRSALEIPYNHHERWDGSGYPRGLRGDSIPLSARIFAIIDVWDSLLSDRPYRSAWPMPKVYEYLHGQSNRQFDPRVVRAFFQIFGA